MRALLPYLAVLLALVASGSIAYIAWDITSERPPDDDKPEDDEAADREPDEQS